MFGSKQIHLGFIAFTLFLLCWDASPIRASKFSNEEDPIEFVYTEGDKRGPEYWGDLKEEWSTCKDGKLQSPIDLRDAIADKVNSTLDHLKIHYKPTQALMKNEGHAISVVWEGDAGGVTINGTEYLLRQCHWHAPSEHTIDGKTYDVELHMVHKDTSNTRVAVVGFLYKIGKPNPFITQVRKAIRSMIKKPTEVHLGVVDPRKMKKAQKGKQDAAKRKMKRMSSKFYRYMGSFTTPPCTEGVTWTINKQVHTVSRSQVALLQKAVYKYAEMNSRPVQPLNDREVKLHGSSFSK
ncbi:hypothetical protein ACFX13_009488 [Malus domestica]|uniref:alpha carbonic anhydrase 7-like isoform X1 n=1 Tax=Malus domestica TaxID=3750 RepID=UPI0010A9C23F|nr:alpha carbonic anhydrase 7-like isoform X1 [Malus domestica]